MSFFTRSQKARASTGVLAEAKEPAAAGGVGGAAVGEAAVGRAAVGGAARGRVARGRAADVEPPDIHTSKTRKRALSVDSVGERSVAEAVTDVVPSAPVPAPGPNSGTGRTKMMACASKERIAAALEKTPTKQTAVRARRSLSEDPKKALDVNTAKKKDKEVEPQAEPQAVPRRKRSTSRSGIRDKTPTKDTPEVSDKEESDDDGAVKPPTRRGRVRRSKGGDDFLDPDGVRVVAILNDLSDVKEWNDEEREITDSPAAGNEVGTLPLLADLAASTESKEVPQQIALDGILNAKQTNEGVLGKIDSTMRGSRQGKSGPTIDPKTQAAPAPAQPIKNKTNLAEMLRHVREERAKKSTEAVGDAPAPQANQAPAPQASQDPVPAAAADDIAQGGGDQSQKMEKTPKGRVLERKVKSSAKEFWDKTNKLEQVPKAKYTDEYLQILIEKHAAAKKTHEQTKKNYTDAFNYLKKMESDIKNLEGGGILDTINTTLLATLTESAAPLRTSVHKLLSTLESLKNKVSLLDELIRDVKSTLEAQKASKPEEDAGDGGVGDGDAGDDADEDADADPEPEAEGGVEMGPGQGQDPGNIQDNQAPKMKKATDLHNKAFGDLMKTLFDTADAADAKIFKTADERDSDHTDDLHLKKCVKCTNKETGKVFTCIINTITSLQQPYWKDIFGVEYDLAVKFPTGVLDKINFWEWSATYYALDSTYDNMRASKYETQFPSMKFLVDIINKLVGGNEVKPSGAGGEEPKEDEDSDAEGGGYGLVLEHDIPKTNELCVAIISVRLVLSILKNWKDLKEGGEKLNLDYDLARMLMNILYECFKSEIVNENTGRWIEIKKFGWDSYADAEFNNFWITNYKPTLVMKNVKNYFAKSVELLDKFMAERNLLDKKIIFSTMFTDPRDVDYKDSKEDPIEEHAKDIEMRKLWNIFASRASNVKKYVKPLIYTVEKPRLKYLEIILEDDAVEKYMVPFFMGFYSGYASRVSFDLDVAAKNRKDEIGKIVECFGDLVNRINRANKSRKTKVTDEWFKIGATGIPVDVVLYRVSTPADKVEPIAQAIATAVNAAAAKKEARIKKAESKRGQSDAKQDTGDAGKKTEDGEAEDGEGVGADDDEHVPRSARVKESLDDFLSVYTAPLSGPDRRLYLVDIDRLHDDETNPVVYEVYRDRFADVNPGLDPSKYAMFMVMGKYFSDEHIDEDYEYALITVEIPPYEYHLPYIVCNIGAVPEVLHRDIGSKQLELCVPKGYSALRRIHDPDGVLTDFFYFVNLGGFTYKV